MTIWVVFISAVLLLLIFDMAVVNRHPHTITMKEATIWTVIWISIALSFSGVLHWLYASGLVDNASGLSPEIATIKYISAYLIELSLSMDNLFVMALIFTSFEIPSRYQHRVLFLGILGAIVFRGLMIFFGLALINLFNWVIYLFGAFLIYTAIKMFFSAKQVFNPRRSFVFKGLRRIIPITKGHYEHRLFIRRRFIVAATPLFIALLIIEGTDVLFALDSIPAVLAISSDPFIIFSSNILAILGLRTMYFFLANLLQKFTHLHYSLSAILLFVGLKMMAGDYIHLPEWVSLAVICISLLTGIITSAIRTSRIESEFSGN